MNGEKQFQALHAKIEQLQQENTALKAELEQKSKTLDMLASHNLKQGILLDFHGLKPESIARDTINKIKADAIREALNNCGSYITSEDATGFLTELEEYANNLEGKK